MIKIGRLGVPFLCGVSLFLIGCGEASKSDSIASATSSKTTAPAPLKEWDEFRFGMTFDQAIAAASGLRWDGESFQRCRKEIPVKGCSLSADPESSYRETFAGMELQPTLDFNEDGRLTDVNMGRVYRAGVTVKQCHAMHGRLLDRLTAMYGRSVTKAEKESVVMRSPAGNEYRSTSLKGIMVAGINRFRTAIDGSDVALLTTFTPKTEYSEAACFVGFYVDGPKSLRRRPLEDVDATASSDETE